MTDQEKREKVIRGVECCLPFGPCKREDCPYYKGNSCLETLHSDILALLKAQEPIEARLHLCESCAKEYPECDATSDDIMFGRGIGNDNVIGCMAYINQWKHIESVEPKRNVNWIGERRCGNCNREIDKYDGTKFCPNCGREVKWDDN